MEFKDQPCSTKLLGKLTNTLIVPAMHNLPVTLFTFTGAGKSSEIRYLLSNIYALDVYEKDRVFTFLDLGLLRTESSAALAESLVFIANFFEESLTSEQRNKLKSISESSVTEPQYLAFITELVKSGTNITFVLENSDRIFEDITGKAASIVQILHRTSPMKVSFIFLCTKEIAYANSTIAVQLGELFTRNINWGGGDLLFDKESIACAVTNYEKWNHVKFDSAELAKSLEPLVFGDPSTLKILLTKACVDNDYATTLMSGDKELILNETFKLLKEPLDARFLKLFSSLSVSTLECFTGENTKPSDFLVNTGLVKNKDGKPVFLNVLIERYIREFDFTAYLKNRAKRILTASGDDDSKFKLSGQEFVVKKYLDLHSDAVISRDEVAKAIWGDTWEQKYSDWAIDQVMSRLRTKLTKANSAKNIKTIKGQGFIYS